MAFGARLLDNKKGRKKRVASHVCPWWVGYLLINPLRKIYQPPKSVLGEFVKPGMTVLDIGPGMGYFSLWMARVVRESGRVVCVDVQQKMIDALKRRADKRGLGRQIDARVCGDSSLGIDDLAGQVDFALAFAVVHEVPDALRLFDQIYRALKSEGHLFLAEPSGHVSKRGFEETEELAVRAGFQIVARPRVRWSRTVLLARS